MPTEVLVVFHCRSGGAERLALAAAVGAVQARALIRLRRLTDTGSEPSDSDETLTRMRKEYVAPTEADFLRADAMVFAAAAGFTPDAPEWRPHFELLARLQSEGALQGKVAAVLAENNSAEIFLSRVIDELGFATVRADSEDPVSTGRRVAIIATDVKRATAI